ncbi:MAG: hypothetical protein ACI9HK_003213 [Pirellulaceae bacterium]
MGRCSDAPIQTQNAVLSCASRQCCVDVVGEEEKGASLFSCICFVNRHDSRASPGTKCCLKVEAFGCFSDPVRRSEWSSSAGAQANEFEFIVCQRLIDTLNPLG